MGCPAPYPSRPPSKIWVGVTLLGGPMLDKHGKVMTKFLYSRVLPAGLALNESVADWDKILSGVRQFFKQCFSQEIRKMSSEMAKRLAKAKKLTVKQKKAAAAEALATQGATIVPAAPKFAIGDGLGEDLDLGELGNLGPDIPNWLAHYVPIDPVLAQDLSPIVQAVGVLTPMSMVPPSDFDAEDLVSPGVHNLYPHHDMDEHACTHHNADRNTGLTPTPLSSHSPLPLPPPGLNIIVPTALIAPAHAPIPGWEMPVPVSQPQSKVDIASDMEDTQMLKLLKRGASVPDENQASPVKRRCTTNT
ncbi:hypothetical protein C8R44DRAFT_748253 [Mycena epipterygia]|nr:hypothetical protein C8R44DRAFT_748253 [Mycena epipterygia]